VVAGYVLMPEHMHLLVVEVVIASLPELHLTWPFQYLRRSLLQYLQCGRER
jgi:hypothetical protein